MQSTGQKRRSLFILMIIQLTTNLSSGIVAPILGLFIRSQGLSIAQVGLIGTASMLGWFIWEPIMGLLSDTFSKRLMLIGSLIIITILYSLYSFADNFLRFLVLEFTRTSIMSAYSIPVKALAAEFLPIQDRGKIYGRYMMIIGLGGMVSPLIGGYISEFSSFRIPFYLSAIFSLFGGIAALFIQYNEVTDDSKSPISSFIKNLLSPQILAIFSVRGLYFFNSGFSGSFISIFLNESSRFGASESQIGLFFTILRFTGAFSRSFLGDLCDRIGNKPIISVSLIGLSFSYFSLIYLSGFYAMCFIGAIQGLFQAAADTSMMLQLIDVMPGKKSGLTMGLYSESENIGGLISTPTIGYLYHNYGANISILLVAVILLLNASYSHNIIKGKARMGT
jgi:MFS family permease